MQVSRCLLALCSDMEKTEKGAVPNLIPAYYTRGEGLNTPIYTSSWELIVKFGAVLWVVGYMQSLLK